MRIFTVAGILGVGGIYLEEPWLTWVAIAMLTGAMALRFLPGADEGAHVSGEDEEAWDEGGWEEDEGE